MNSFDFINQTPFGQYIPLESIIHRLDPRVRLIGFSLLLLAIVFTPALVGVLCGLLVAITGIALAKLPLRFVLKGIWAPLPFLLILAVLQILFNAQTQPSPLIWQVGSLEITRHDILLGITLIIRFSALIILISLATLTLSTSQVTTALFYLLAPLQKLKLPVHDLVMIVQIMLRFLPLIALSAEKIAKAQASRGADWSRRGFNPIRQAKQILPMFVPLIIISLQRAEALALAMDARGYGGEHPRTCLHALAFHFSDGVALTVMSLMAVAVVLVGSLVQI